MTFFNEKKLVQGRIDLSLSLNGIDKICQLRNEEYLKEIDIIFSSPLKRAVETATLLNKNIKKSIRIDNRLIERDFALIEGKSFNYKEKMKEEYKDEFISNFHIEDFESIKRRIYSFLDEIKEKYSSKNILVISHGGLFRVFSSYFTHSLNQDNFEKLLINNGEVKKYEFTSI